MNFTQSQLSAIEHQGRFLAVSAGAGSGKTSVLVEKIIRLGIKKVLAITFTEKAAFDIKKKLLKKVKDETDIASASVGTFHSFCSKILREHAPRIGLDPDFSVLEQESADILIRRSAKDTLLEALKDKNEAAVLAVEELDFKNTIECLVTLIRSRWHTEQYAGLGEPGEKERLLRNAVLQLYRSANERYTKLKRGNLDFNDLEIFGIELLKIKDIREKYQQQYSHILVDEFQDVNDTQSVMIGLLYSEKQNHLTIVGDDKQSIYRFRGANVEHFRSATKKAGSVIELLENFRSRPEILEFVGSALPHFARLKPTKPNVPAVITPVITGDSSVAGSLRMTSEDLRRLEAIEIAKVIPRLSGTTACLFRSLNDSYIYQNVLSENNIPYIVFGGRGFLSKPEVLDIINALRLINDRNDIVGLLGTARSPYVNLSDEELLLICTDNGKGLYEKIRDGAKGEFLRKLESIAPYLSISEQIREISNVMIPSPSPLPQGEREIVESEDTEKLYHIAKEMELKESISLPDFLEYITYLSDKDAKLSEFPQGGSAAVVMMTIHQAKGLEFENVILCDTIRRNHSARGPRFCFVKNNSGGLGFKMVPEDNEEADPKPTEYCESLFAAEEKAEEKESERLLYVAMTRAKDRLIIPVHSGNPAKNTVQYKIKEIVTEFGLKTIELPERVELPSPLTGEGVRPHERLPTPSRTYTVSALETFERCPYEYFLSFELKIPTVNLTPNLKKAGLSASIKGDITHKLIEINSLFPISDAKKEIEKLRVEMEIAEIGPKDSEDIAKRFELYKKSEYANRPSSINETPFMYKLGNAFVKGTIDMLTDGSNGWEIVDFKTGAGENAQDELEKYRLQLLAYSLAAEKMLNKKNGTVTLVFLGKDGLKTAQKKVGPADLCEIEDILSGHISKIEKEEFTATPGEKCKKCPYSTNKACCYRMSS